MPDPRLESFFADALARGWQPSWSQGPDRIQVLINPPLTSLNPANKIPDCHSGQLCIGFGVALTGDICCWVKQGYRNTFIVPWTDGEAENLLLDALPLEAELTRFPIVRTFDEGLALFDAAVARYMAEMRQFVQEDEEYRDQVNDWGPMAPVSAR